METDDDTSRPKGKEEKGKPIMVIMVGAPGSGKSTFCDQVMSLSTSPWIRVCQELINVALIKDTIGNGKAGTAQCLKSAANALEDGKSVSVKRTGHEGNFQGGTAAAVVNRMLQTKELPKLGEGFTRILFFQNESDVQAAFNICSAFGPLDSLSDGAFGQKNPEAIHSSWKN
ncbi:hypothetical protein FNV43_RR08828 [Rhamnella rubrinervis]|uniref:Uncharacterized protein n=1 Tax=Rhamnella rubrinervis TaxID=2594499 RepID=A0A8K0MJM3_9ROSA|nr:hypothetical protein FNV43_RR08828 [Rhamnella rubrinervis]